MLELNKDDIVKDAILKAAERVFQRWGINKTTMEDIASEAGKGKSTLYYYYKSKEEIFDAVVIVEFGKILEKAQKSTENVASAKEKLIKYFVASIHEMKNKISAYTIIREEIKRNQNFIEKIRTFFEAKEEQFIIEILKLGIESKEFKFFKADELHIAAKTIMGIIHAMELYLLLENDDENQVDIAAKLIANGL
jgi:AcrR family transcriptional regulator